MALYLYILVFVVVFVLFISLVPQRFKPEHIDPKTGKKIPRRSLYYLPYGIDVIFRLTIGTFLKPPQIQVIEGIENSKELQRIYDAVLDPNKTGTICKMGAFGRKSLLINEPECIDYILSKNFPNYPKPENIVRIKIFLFHI